MTDCIRYSDYELVGNSVWHVSNNKWTSRINPSTEDDCRRECVSDPECKLWRYNQVASTCELSSYNVEDIETLKDSYVSGRVNCVSNYSMLRVLILSVSIALILILLWYLTKPCSKNKNA